MTEGQPRRAVVLVGGPAAPYSRGLRIARSLASLGYEVEIAAVAADGVPDQETDGEITIRRYRPSGWFAPRASTGAGKAAPAGTDAAPESGEARPTQRRRRGPLPRIVDMGTRIAGRLIRWAFWPHTVRGWWATLDRDLAAADLYHACGSLTIAPALHAAARARRQGRAGLVIYDAIDNVFEGNNVLQMPPIVRRVHAARERRWARRSGAIITVNDELSSRLSHRWQVPPILSVPNYPEPWKPQATGAADRIRTAAGLSPDTRVVLFQGRLGPNLGLDEAAEAVLQIDGACLVLLGFGRWFEQMRRRDQDPRFAGRHVTLPAVHPDELPSWTASADVSLVTLPPVSANQRASTPNKFWESLLVGTPVVVGPKLDVMAGIVAELGAGVVAASMEPAAIAQAIGTLLAVPAATAAAERRRVAAEAARRFSWPVAAAGYEALVRSLRV